MSDLSRDVVRPLCHSHLDGNANVCICEHAAHSQNVNAKQRSTDHHLLISLAGDLRMLPKRLLAAIGPFRWLPLIEPAIRPKLDSPTLLSSEGLPGNGTALWLGESYDDGHATALPMR